MAQKCAICQSESLIDINTLMQRSVAISKIALEFGFTERQAGLHWHNHVKPFIETADILAQQAIVDARLEFHKEATLPLLTKQLASYSRLCDRLDASETTDEFLAITKEMRGWFNEEAKLRGAYVKDAENPATSDDIAAKLTANLQALGWSDAKIAELTKRPIASLVGAQELGDAD